MNFLLKIVEGPNKGAEVALVEGVVVTLGKSDECDIVLADPTLPDAPLSLEATPMGVTVDGESLEPFNVRTAGATSFAVGPEGAPWSPLVWPKPEETEVEGQKAEDRKSESDSAKTENSPEVAQAESATNGSTAQRSNGQTGHRRRGCFGCLLAIILILLILALLGWFFRGVLAPRANSLLERSGVKWRVRGAGSTAVVEADVPVSPSFALEKLADKYDLELQENDGRATLSGNFATRAERLRATAEAYASRPGINLDLSDDESFLSAAEDALFTLTEGALKVTVATNRYLHVTGTSTSPLDLQKTLEALNSDLPKLRGFDASGVVLESPTFPMPPAAKPAATVQRSNGSAAKRPAQPALPVCGILTTPYPCLVMRDGARVLEGGTVGGSVILKIEADSVTITNAAGRFTWKP